MMKHTEQAQPFTYWKRPWGKWCILAAGLLQLAALWGNIGEYRQYQDLAARGVISPSLLATLAADCNYSCALNGMAAAGFLSVFLIGCFARSQRAARLAEGCSLLGLALVWSVMGFGLGLAVSDGQKILWAVFLLLFAAGGAYSLWKVRSKPEDM